MAMTRHEWTAAGALSFALGWIGLALPLMPGAVLLIAAAYCFARQPGLGAPDAR